MRVKIYVENSQGEEVKLFDETVSKDEQRMIINVLVQQVISIERTLARYIATMGEDP